MSVWRRLRTWLSIAGQWLWVPVSTWRERWRFAAVAGLVGLAGYLPLAALEPQLLFERIVAYPGSGVETPRGIPIWGIAHVLGLAGTRAAELCAEYNTLVCWAPILGLAWLRRGIAEGVPGTAMPPWRGPLSDGDIAWLARRLQSAAPRSDRQGD